MYKAHKLSFYAFQTYPPADHVFDGSQTHWKLGKSEIILKSENNKIRLTGNLVIPYAGGATPLVGKLNLEGESRQTQLKAESEGFTDHVWSPMMLRGQGRFDYTIDGQSQVIEGSAYFDRNQSNKPLPHLGIDDWHWCRLSFPKETLVLYFLKSKEGTWQRWAFRSNDTKDLEPIKVSSHRVQNPKTDRYGIKWHLTHELELETVDTPLQLSLMSPVDRSPFYMRHLVRANLGAVWSNGVYERILPQKIDQTWMQPLIAMRINEWHRNKSMWLALFEGPSGGKIRRLWRSWLSPQSIETKEVSL